MTRNEYRRLCEQHSSNWLYWCVKDPTPYMKPRHIAIIRIVLRNRGVAV